MHSKKIRKQRKTRRGGLLNMRTPKSQKDNIKDWYLYWRKTFSYNDQYRYPGYFNLGISPRDMNETRDVLYQSNDIDNVPGCLIAVRSDRYENYKKPENIKKCGANLSGENEKYHRKYWKCNFCNKGRLVTTSLLEDEANLTADKVIVISNNNHEYDCAPDQQRVLNHIAQRELNERVMTNNHIPVVEHYEIVETL